MLWVGRESARQQSIFAMFDRTVNCGWKATCTRPFLVEVVECGEGMVCEAHASLTVVTLGGDMGTWQEWPFGLLVKKRYSGVGSSESDDG